MNKRLSFVSIFSIAVGLLSLAGQMSLAQAQKSDAAQGAVEITYPRTDVSPEDVFTQETLNKLTSNVMSWQQAPGTFGQLWLHSTWGESSSLSRRYHGQSTSNTKYILWAAMRFYEAGGDPYWKRLATEVVSNVLFLQLPDGGFMHATAEFEPTYVSYQATCPIHQGNAAWTLLDYADWEHAEPLWKEAAHEALVRHFGTFNKAFWQKGNGWKNPIDFPGWCGVTNQDLVVVANYARFGKIFGDFSYYEEWGKPVLDYLLSPAYYHEEAGLFRRGDSPNFVERTAYYYVIVDMLEKIHECTGDERLPAVIDNVSEHLFDAIFVDEQGMTHLAWGALTAPDDESEVVDWKHYPVSFSSYPKLIPIMRRYLERHPDAERSRQLDELERTLAAYVFADGTIPLANNPDKPLFNVVGGTNHWHFLIERLGENLEAPQIVPVPVVHRTCDNVTFKSGPRHWAIEKDDATLFRGFKLESRGIAVGEDESIANVNFSVLEKPDYVEHY